MIGACLFDLDGTLLSCEQEAFGLVWFQTAVAHFKWPAPEIFARAHKRLGVKAAECIFVGDHPINDIAAAKAAGMKAIWKRDRYWQAPVEADGTIEELSELLKWT
ncbi:HAD-IA family hydrolase [Brevibacillus sp. H7]|uniref:HAD-IA family hydrolase n=1 Tax=Brevibacillus sp. H7 TaxID=3349138 RepID=UPI0037F86A7D